MDQLIKNLQKEKSLEAASVHIKSEKEASVKQEVLKVLKNHYSQNSVKKIKYKLFSEHFDRFIQKMHLKLKKGLFVNIKEATPYELLVNRSHEY